MNSPTLKREIVVYFSGKNVSEIWNLHNDSLHVDLIKVNVNICFYSDV